MEFWDFLQNIVLKMTELWRLLGFGIRKVDFAITESAKIVIFLKIFQLKKFK